MNYFSIFKAKRPNFAFDFIFEYKIIGKKGFGYDPIFIPFKKKITFGQMFKSKKIKMDHRFIAFQKLKKKIKI